MVVLIKSKYEYLHHRINYIMDQQNGRSMNIYTVVSTIKWTSWQVLAIHVTDGNIFTFNLVRVTIVFKAESFERYYCLLS